MSNIRPAPSVIVEESVQFTLDELGRATRTSTEWLVTLVHEGVLAPLPPPQAAGNPHELRFGGDALRRARRAARLLRDFELNLSGVALALDLLDRIDALQQRIAADTHPAGRPR
jgi:chaperone modulatory protein CbpM